MHVEKLVNLTMMSFTLKYADKEIFLNSSLKVVYWKDQKPDICEVNHIFKYKCL